MTWVLAIVIVILLIVIIRDIHNHKNTVVDIRSAPVNVIDGVTYPEPTDPRWRRKILDSYCSFHYQLGEENLYVSISASSDYGGITINEVKVSDGDKPYKYGMAIRNSVEAHDKQRVLSDACSKGLIRLPESA